MSYVRIDITPFGSSKTYEVTRDLISISNLKLFNDESNFFGGVFRRSFINIVLNNNERRYSLKDDCSIFEDRRESSLVELYYIANNPNLNPYLFFRGFITEGSTEQDLTKKNIKLTIVDLLKSIDELTLEDSELLSFEKNLNEEFISDYLKLVFSKKDPNLNNLFNVFESDGTTDKISCTLESIYQPSDDFYDSKNTSCLDILNNLMRGVNSYSVIENFVDRSELHIKSRPNFAQSIKKTIDINEILTIENQTNGFNKVYNKISINNSEPYVDEQSVIDYGERTLDISSYSAPSKALADTYFSYFSNPKKELDLTIILNHDNLDLKIGDRIKLELEDIFNNFTLQPINENLFVIRQELDFSSETIRLRLREF